MKITRPVLFCAALVAGVSCMAMAIYIFFAIEYIQFPTSFFVKTLPRGNTDLVISSGYDIDAHIVFLLPEKFVSMQKKIKIRILSANGHKMEQVVGAPDLAECNWIQTVPKGYKSFSLKQAIELKMKDGNNLAFLSIEPEDAAIDLWIWYLMRRKHRDQKSIAVFENPFAKNSSSLCI